MHRLCRVEMVSTTNMITIEQTSLNFSISGVGGGGAGAGRMGGGGGGGGVMYVEGITLSARCYTVLIRHWPENAKGRR